MKIIRNMIIPLSGEKDAALRVLVGDVSDWIADDAPMQQYLPLLSPHRRTKADAFKQPRGRVLCVGVSLLLDMLLQEVGMREHDMSYVEGEHGKPLFVDNSLPVGDFSLSHSGHIVAAALIDHPSACRVGIDVQRVARYRPELVRRMFGAEERAALAACTTEAGREQLFTRYWCRAEAYAKATGQGLQWPTPTPPPEASFSSLDMEPEYGAWFCILHKSDITKQ